MSGCMLRGKRRDEHRDEKKKNHKLRREETKNEGQVANKSIRSEKRGVEKSSVSWKVHQKHELTAFSQRDDSGSCDPAPTTSFIKKDHKLHHTEMTKYKTKTDKN